MIRPPPSSTSRYSSSRRTTCPRSRVSGFLAARQREWHTSEVYWRKAVALLDKQPSAKTSKQYETASIYLGTSLLEQDQFEEACASFKQALRVNSSAPDTHYLLAAAYKGMGAKDEYRSELETVLDYDPKMPEANYDYGVLLLEGGDRAGAAEHFRVAIDQGTASRDPERALEKLGPFAERMQAARAAAASDVRKALVEARIACALEPRDAVALLLVGSLYEKNGDTKSASEAYNSVVAVDPGNAKAKAGLERVRDAARSATSALRTDGGTQEMAARTTSVGYAAAPLTADASC